MKNYKITVNGMIYDVVVEETGATPSIPVAKAPTPAVAAAPAAPLVAMQAPLAEQKPAQPAVQVAAGTQGSIKITSPMPGKILTVKATLGQAVKRGEVVFILEAMKMENEIVAPEDGTITSIDVAEGKSVESGDLLGTLE